MELYNHITQNTLKINPDDNIINIYVCGPTVHNKSHIGHARTFSIFDSIRKYLASKRKIVN